MTKSAAAAPVNVVADATNVASDETSKTVIAESEIGLLLTIYVNSNCLV